MKYVCVLFRRDNSMNKCSLHWYTCTKYNRKLETLLERYYTKNKTDFSWDFSRTANYPEFHDITVMQQNVFFTCNCNSNDVDLGK